jgi:hypothetical protein
VGKLQGKIPLGTNECRWEGNIKMNLRDNECEGMGWIELNWLTMQFKD